MDEPQAHAATGNRDMNITNLLKIFFFSDLHSERTIKKSLLYAAIPIALFTILSLQQFRIDRPLDVRRWQVRTLIELSANDEFCGSRGYITNTEKYQLYDLLLSNDKKFLDTPIKDIINLQFDGIERYCGTLKIPVIKNENSLRVVLDLLIGIHNNITLNQIGWLFFLIKFLVLCFLIFAFIYFGASVALALLSACIGLSILSYFKGVHFYSTYPFTFVFMILYAMLLSIFMKKRLSASLNLFVIFVFPLAMGILTGFVANIRTSHFPALFMLFATYLACKHVSIFRNKALHFKSVGIGIAVVAIFFLGYKFYDKTFIQPLIPLWDNPRNYAHHAIMHSVVLGLARPENELSKEENITWKDSVGLEIARRIDPNVHYLSPKYGKVLLEYYVKLWIYKTHQMIDTYKLKMKTAGVSVVKKAKHMTNGSIYNAILYPLHFLDNGAYILLISMAYFAVSLVLFFKTNKPLLFFLSLLALAGFLLQLEATFVYSTFYPNFQTYLSVLASFLVNFALCLYI